MAAARAQRGGRGRNQRSGAGVVGVVSMAVSAVVVIAAVLLVGAFAFIAEANRAGPSGAGAVFIVPEGASARNVAHDLEQLGQIRNDLMFRAALRVYARGQMVRAGEYEIPERASVRQIVGLLSEGRAVLHSVTVPEGYTSAQVVRVLMDAPMLTGEIEEIPPEGSLLPETYHVSRGMSRESVIRQMRDAHDAVLAEVWANRAANLPIDTPEELVILASIVEKETGVAAERPEVAAVYVNRLRRPMRLESDPTIIYGINQGEPLYNAAGQRRTLRRSEIDNRANRYNTYQHDGLPPGPIANPGRASLEATANPAQTDAIFFVADGSGGHAFADTLAEHNANVARWRSIERERIAAERR